MTLKAADATPITVRAEHSECSAWQRGVARFRSLGNGTFAVADQAVVSAANFATSVILGRMASRDDLGVYFLALSLFYFFRGVQEQLISAPFLVYCQKRPAGSIPSYVGSTLAHQLGMSLLAMLSLLVLAAGLRTGYGPQQFVPAIPVLLGAMPFLLLRDFVRQYSFATFQVRGALGFDAAAAVIQVTGLVAFAAAGRLSVTTTYLTMAAACATSVLGWFLVVRPSVRLSRADISSDWRTNWTFGRWALASQLIGCTMPYVMPWIVATADGADAAGVFGASSTLVGIANMFVLGLSNYLSPRAAQAFSTGGVSEMRAVLLRTAALFGVVLGLFALATFFAGNRMIGLVYGGDFQNGGTILAILSLNLLVSSLGVTAGNGLWAMERPQANFAGDVTALLTTVAAAFWFVPRFGAAGIAAATLVGTAAGTIVRTATLVLAMKQLGTTDRAQPSSPQGGGDA